jgi:hypothetical protein
VRVFTHRRDMLTVLDRLSAIIISRAIPLRLVSREVYVSSCVETSSGDATQTKELGR